MEAFQERVIAEKTELDARIMKLEVFLGGDIYQKLTGYAQGLLKYQRSIMLTYSIILAVRIADYKRNAPNEGGDSSCPKQIR